MTISSGNKQGTLTPVNENISNLEVKDALFAMAPWKAPGPDGLPTGFYQNGWCEMGSSIGEFVKSIWRNPVEVATGNFTDIFLIPRIDKPEFVNQFLCAMFPTK
ncbi:hypothetical protein QL285_046540 [Trifolium repens]|nr:hypothetical protein QL285_046540 [Trifolium repens]